MKIVPFARFAQAHLLSDLHLDEHHPVLTDLCIAFLRNQARHGGALFLLGDIFEVWVGDDDDAVLPATIAHELREVAESGIPIFFMHGNRDFLLGQAFAERAGMQLLPDPSVVALSGVDTLLSHGDRYCLSDQRYNAFRRQVRDPAWQAALLAQPLNERRALAKKLRQESIQAQEAQYAAGVPWADVDEGAIVEEMARSGSTRMIHGHTHRPGVHTITLPGGKRGERIVLADWRGNEGEFLSVNGDGGFERHVLR